MGKALGIDYGTKRTGIAITDAMQIIASGLTTVETHTLDDFISNLVQKESIECFVVGDPKNLDGTATDSTGHVNGFVKRVHLDSKQDICINDTNLQNKHEEFNEHLQNGVAFKPSENIQTVQVDIH